MSDHVERGAQEEASDAPLTQTEREASQRDHGTHRRDTQPGRETRARSLLRKPDRTDSVPRLGHAAPLVGE